MAGEIRIMSKTKPIKSELAYFKVLSDQGMTPNAIGKLIGRDPKTVSKYLSQEITDPEVERMVELIRQAELSQLHQIGLKSRIILIDYLDSVLAGEREVNPISVTAILDRTFTQRRLLEGSSTMNISSLTAIIHAVHEKRHDEEVIPDKPAEGEEQ